MTRRARVIGKERRKVEIGTRDMKKKKDNQEERI